MQALEDQLDEQKEITEELEGKIAEFEETVNALDEEKETLEMLAKIQEIDITAAKAEA